MIVCGFILDLPFAAWAIFDTCETASAVFSH